MNNNADFFFNNMGLCSDMIFDSDKDTITLYTGREHHE